MRKVFFRSFLAVGLAATLVSCGDHTPDSANAAARFQEQRSVQCALEYTLTLRSQTPQGEEGSLTEALQADADIDLTQNSCHLTGTLTHSDDAASQLPVEAYSTAQNAYYRYGDTYYSEAEANTYLSLLLAPLALHLESGYTASDVTELIYGSECTVFTGTEIADDAPQRLIWDGTPQALSLDGCLIDVTLLVSQSTSLPAEVRLSYANLDDLEISFTTDDETVYTLEQLDYTITYRSYGAEVDTAVPEEFQRRAEAGTLGTQAGTEYTEPTADGTYELHTANDKSLWRICTPDFMELETYTQNEVNFQYYYDSADLEELTYRIEENTASEDMTAFAQTLAKQYKAMDGVSKVKDGGVQSATVNDLLVKYIVLSLRYAQDGTDYQVVRIVSWTEAPDSQDCLVVEITEYNGNENGEMIEPADELEAAYACVTFIEQ